MVGDAVMEVTSAAEDAFASDSQMMQSRRYRHAAGPYHTLVGRRDWGVPGAGEEEGWS